MSDRERLRRDLARLGLIVVYRQGFDGRSPRTVEQTAKELALSVKQVLQAETLLIKAVKVIGGSK